MSDIKEEKRLRINEHFGQHTPIKKLAKDKDITLLELSKKSLIGQSRLSELLSGKINIYLHQLVQIAEILDCKVSDILPMEWQSDKSSKSESISNKENLDYMRSLMIGFDRAAERCKKKPDPEVRANVIIALFEDTYMLSDEEKVSRIQDRINFYLRAMPEAEAQVQ